MTDCPFISPWWCVREAVHCLPWQHPHLVFATHAVTDQDTLQNWLFREFGQHHGALSMRVVWHMTDERTRELLRVAYDLWAEGITDWLRTPAYQDQCRGK